MAGETAACAKCGAPMELGFIIDHIDGEGTRMQSKWIEGKPEMSWLMGLRFGDKRRLEIWANRCTACGFLEMFAPERDNSR